jgi:hypothetical protein
VGEAGFDQVIATGRIKWAVTEDGTLVVIPKWVKGQEIAHTVLTGGAPVLAAGEAEVAGGAGGYFGLEITNYSGHYLASEASLDVGRSAFAAAGVLFP